MVSLETLKQEFLEYVNNFRETWLKKEADEKEKKQLVNIFMSKKTDCLIVGNREVQKSGNSQERVGRTKETSS